MHTEDMPSNGGGRPNYPLTAVPSAPPVDHEAPPTSEWRSARALVREHPVAVVLTAVLVGFALGRVLR